ncbi:hypothetical protein INR49_000853 [Caranx melampygus]|nr:hypothetical protein INR49_000853 [Caranx melampygus]
MSSSISSSVQGQGDDEEKEGVEEDEERQRGGAGAEPSGGSTAHSRLLTVKSDGRGISMLFDTFSRPLDVAALAVTLRRHQATGLLTAISQIPQELARRLASAVKRGQSYFHLLQKEEREEREREEKLRTRREEQQRMEPRPPLFSSDSGSDSEGWTVPAGASCSGENEVRPRRKKRQSARPFTPIHHSLASPLLSKAPREVIYRQLCCLNWLLEALTLDGSGKVGPLTACWDPKDPGRGSATMKTLRKERAIENKWEHLVESTQDGLTARLHAHHTSSNSPLTFTTMGSSTLSSLVQHPEEDPVEDPGAAEGTDRPPSECFHTPTHARQRRKKERQKPQTSSVAASLTTPHPSPDKIQDDKSGSKSKARSFRPKSCPAQPPSAISHVISSKASMLQELRAAFDQRAEETAQRYIEVLELKARERLTSGLQRYRALCHMTESHHAPRHVTCESQETEAPTNSYNENKHSNNMWLYSLLSRLPAEVCRERAVSRVLQKLRGFAEQQTTIIVRPHVFLRVLGGLEPWELFLPELCVAIQVALQHVVQMPREKYDVWLQGSLSPHGATLPPPLIHQVNHTQEELKGRSQARANRY